MTPLQQAAWDRPFLTEFRNALVPKVLPGNWAVGLSINL
jgi:hypothetical protein